MPSNQYRSIFKSTHPFYWLAFALVIYMPLHVLIAQSASLLTGGLEAWKAAKDVLVFGLAPLFLYDCLRRGLYKDATFRLLLGLGAVYALLHGVFLLFDTDDHTRSTLIGSVFNTRLLVYMLIGYSVGSLAAGRRYVRLLTTAAVVIAGAVALFGVLQYFLPGDILTYVGYTLERGVKPLFYIDDKPDLPRVMSTLKDPNSLAAFLIVPLLLTTYAYMSNAVNKGLFARPLRREVLGVIGGASMLGIILTFSRGGLIALSISIVAILYIVTGERVVLGAVKKYWPALAILGVIGVLALIPLKNTYLVQNVVFHADQSTVLADPNELRVELNQRAVDAVADSPVGHGPGSAGLVSISNPKGTFLTENYYLQVAYEVGWLGLMVFLGILAVVATKLYRQKSDPLAVVLLASLAGYAFYGLLIHLWSNEAIALQWWLLAGVLLGSKIRKQATS